MPAIKGRKLCKQCPSAAHWVKYSSISQSRTALLDQTKERTKPVLSLPSLGNNLEKNKQGSFSTFVIKYMSEFKNSKRNSGIRHCELFMLYRQ